MIESTKIPDKKDFSSQFQDPYTSQIQYHSKMFFKSDVIDIQILRRVVAIKIPYSKSDKILTK